MFDFSKKKDEKVQNIKFDPVAYEADNVEVSFAEIQAAMRLGIIAAHSVTSTYQAGKVAIRTYTFQVYEEHLVKLTQAEAEGLMGRTDPDV